MRLDLFIQNRDHERLFIVYEGEPKSRLALLAHGLSDVHDSPHMQALERGLRRAGYAVLRWDASNSWGRSGGKLERATLTKHFADMQDVVAWAKTQEWYPERAPILVGHSLGGAAAMKLAVANPKLVSSLILVSPLVAGSLLAQALNPLLQTLWWLVRILPEPGNPGSRYHYGLLHDARQYDGRLLVPKLKLNVDIISGAQDKVVPVWQQVELFQRIPKGFGAMTIIGGAAHTFDNNLDKLERLISAILKNRD